MTVNSFNTNLSVCTLYTVTKNISLNFTMNLYNYSNKICLLYIPDIVWYLTKVCNPMNTLGIITKCI